MTVIKSLVFSLLLLGLLLLSAPLPVKAQSSIDPSESIKTMQDQVLPVVQWASDWGMKVGFGITGLTFFYYFVIALASPNNK